MEYGESLLSIFNGSEANALANAIEILGLAGASAFAVPKVIRKVKGHIEKCRDNGDGPTLTAKETTP